MHRLRPFAAGALLVVLVVAQAGGPVRAQSTQEDLNRARKQVERLQDDLKAAQARVDEVRARLQSLTTQIAQATNRVEALGAAIVAAEAEIKQSKRKAGRLQDDLNLRARDAYIRGPAGALELVLEADSLTDLSDRLSFLEVLNRADASVAAGVRLEREQVAQFEANLQEYLAEEQHLLDQLAGQRVEQEVLFDEVAAAEAKVEDKLVEARDLVKDLEKKLQRELLQQYGFTGGGTSGPPPEADGPFYWCPVDPPRSYIDDFGAPRVGHTHQGNDIFAPAGTPIRAPFEGTAEESINGLGGIAVHVYASANADYVYNAHLIRHAGVHGQQVTPGTIIGFVGDTGNAAGTPPHDHFEYHPGGGSAVSPYIYLNEACGVGGAGF